MELQQNSGSTLIILPNHYFAVCWLLCGHRQQASQTEILFPCWRQYTGTHRVKTVQGYDNCWEGATWGRCLDKAGSLMGGERLCGETIFEKDLVEKHPSLGEQ